MATTIKPVRVRTQVRGLRRYLQQYNEDLTLHMQKAHRKVMRESVRIVKEAITDTGAIATSNLLNSVTQRLVSSDNRSYFTSTVGFEGSAEKYAGFVEHGRGKGGYPPPAVIANWMDAKGISKGKNHENVYWAVINIGHKGTKGHYFMRRARPLIREKQREIYDRAIKEFTGRIH